jgi:drug/metabolite transporter (DMT)-like permease
MCSRSRRYEPIFSGTDRRYDPAMGKFFKSWTISRATGAGIVAGLVALVLWPIYTLFQEPMHLPFAAALAATAFCGASILVITALDLKFRRGRGFRLRAVRTFDVIVGIAMALPGLLLVPDLLR